MFKYIIILICFIFLVQAKSNLILETDQYICFGNTFEINKNFLSRSCDNVNINLPIKIEITELTKDNSICLINDGFKTCEYFITYDGYELDFKNHEIKSFNNDFNIFKSIIYNLPILESNEVFMILIISFLSFYLLKQIFS